MCRVCVLYLPQILHQSSTLKPAPFFMENVDYQSFNPNNLKGHSNTDHGPKPTNRPDERVGETMPLLLSKKWLAIHFECWTNNRINNKRFRRYVLTPEVLQQAGIPQEEAYSQSLKTFNAVQSMKLIQILFRPLVFLLLAAYTLGAQTPIEPIHQFKTDTFQNGADGNYFLRDTIPGMAVVTDSMVRMVYTGQSGLYRYQSVLSTIVVDALMVQEYRLVVRGDTGISDPVDLSRRFFFLTGGKLDPKRILLFKQAAP